MPLFGDCHEKFVGALGGLSSTHGRLQFFIIPNVPDAFVSTLKKALAKCGLGTEQSNVASGVIACTGNRYCKFAQSDTKGHALALTKWLEKRVEPKFVGLGMADHVPL